MEARARVVWVHGTVCIANRVKGNSFVYVVRKSKKESNVDASLKKNRSRYYV